MNQFTIHAVRILTLSVLVSACVSDPPVSQQDALLPEILTVREDGSMWFRERPIPERDVIFYMDGTRGEKAALRIRMEPLHPDFFRDTIIVVRE